MRPRSALLAITGVAVTWHVYLLALLFGVGTAFDMPARQTFVSELVGPERLPNAIGLNSATFHAARIVGPAAAGFVIAWFGTGWAILSNAVTYLAFIAGLLPARRRPTPDRTRSRRGPSTRSVTRWPTSAASQGSCWRSPSCSVVGTFGMNFQLTSALMAQQEFGLGAEAYGLLGTFMAVGSLAGALVAARRVQSAPRPLLVVDGDSVFGAAEVVAGLMPTYWSYAAVLPLMGLAVLLTLTAANATVQLDVDAGAAGTGDGAVRDRADGRNARSAHR